MGYCARKTVIKISEKRPGSYWGSVRQTVGDLGVSVVTESYNVGKYVPIRKL